MKHIDFLSREGAEKVQINNMMNNDDEAEVRVNPILL